MKKLVLSLGLLLAPVCAAHADSIVFTLNQPNQNTTGSQVTFTGSISAPSSNSGLVYLNADSFTVSGDAAVDDSDFYADTPLYLSPGQSYSGPIFAVDLFSAGGVYTGSFDIQGGSTPDAQNVLGAQNFSITRSVAATPENPSWLLLLTGAVLLTLWRWPAMKMFQGTSRIS